MGAVEQFTEMRAAFEHWFSDEGRSMRAVERDNSGSYRLQQASSAWTAWKAAWSAARTDGVKVDAEALAEHNLKVLDAAARHGVTPPVVRAILREFAPGVTPCAAPCNPSCAEDFNGCYRNAGVKGLDGAQR